MKWYWKWWPVTLLKFIGAAGAMCYILDEDEATLAVSLIKFVPTFRTISLACLLSERTCVLKLCPTARAYLNGTEIAIASPTISELHYRANKNLLNVVIIISHIIKFNASFYEWTDVSLTLFVAPVTISSCSLPCRMNYIISWHRHDQEGTNRAGLCGIWRYVHLSSPNHDDAALLRAVWLTAVESSR